MSEKQAKQSVFQTPHPEELKKAAQADPIQTREGGKEMDGIDDTASAETGREASTELADRQTTIANLGGHSGTEGEIDGHNFARMLTAD